MIPSLPPRLPRDTESATLFSRTPMRPMMDPLPRRRVPERETRTFRPPPHGSRMPKKRGASAQGVFWVHLVWIVPLLVFDFFFFRWLAGPKGGSADVGGGTPVVAAAPGTPGVAEVTEAEPPPPPPPVWQAMHTPTPQQDLLHPDAPGVLQPTGSGRLISAKFGSTRTRANGTAGFHEGVDIAATMRDRRGRPADPVFAVADGRVAMVNSTAGNSSYGKYVVIEHPDPSLGVRTNASGTVVTSTVCTLYAHLADVRFGVRAGAHVRAGEEIATMGTTSNTKPPIPNERGHLHWEIELMLNSRFDRMLREQKTTNLFGTYNGLNLFAIDPLAFYAAHVADPELTFGAYLDAQPAAAELILRGRKPDFFERYPALWKGAPYDGGPMVVAIAESGMPLRGRNATPAEVAKLGNARRAVWKADASVLGRNARGYVSSRTGSWQVTDKGMAWAEQFFY